MGERRQPLCVQGCGGGDGKKYRANIADDEIGFRSHSFASGAAIFCSVRCDPFNTSME